MYYPFKGFNPLGPDAPSQFNGYVIRSDTTILPADWLNFNLKSQYDSVYTSTFDFNTFRPVAGQLPGQLIVDSAYNDTRNTTTTYSVKAGSGRALFNILDVKQRVLMEVMRMTSPRTGSSCSSRRRSSGIR